jgi:hypothetical protein
MIGSISVFMWIASCRQGLLPRARRQARNVSILRSSIVLQRDGLPRQRSFNRSDHVASSSPSRGRRLKTCPVFRRAVGRLVQCRSKRRPKNLCGGRGLRSSDRAPSRALLRPPLPEATGQRTLSVAEADENRTRRRAFARPPILTGTWFPTVGKRWGRPAEVLRRNRRDLEGLTGIAGRPVHKPNRIRRPPPVIERTPARAIRRCVLDRQGPAPGTWRLHEREPGGYSPTIK